MEIGSFVATETELPKCSLLIPALKSGHATPTIQVPGAPQIHLSQHPQYGRRLGLQSRPMAGLDEIPDRNGGISIGEGGGETLRPRSNAR
jgi:hypothetical protein